MTLPASVPAALPHLPRFAACMMKQFGVSSADHGGGKRREGIRLSLWNKVRSVRRPTICARSKSWRTKQADLCAAINLAPPPILLSLAHDYGRFRVFDLHPMR